MNQSARVEQLQRAFDTGDTAFIESWLGLKYVPPAIPHGMDLDDEFGLVLKDIRGWVASIYRRLYEPVAA